jgi:hypothetical protein
MKETHPENPLKAKYRHEPSRVKRIFDRFHGWVPGAPPLPDLDYAPALSTYQGPSKSIGQTVDILMRIKKDGLESLRSAEDVDGAGRHQHDGQQRDQGLHAHQAFGEVG